MSSLYCFSANNTDCVYTDQYPGYELYPGFYYLWDMAFTCTQRILDINVLVYMMYISILVSEYYILFAQVLVVYISNSTNWQFVNPVKVVSCNLFATAGRHFDAFARLNLQ